jgi:hypothetical protein
VIMTGRIDGEQWRASHFGPLIVRGGILALTGFDSRGRGISIAVALERVGEEQRVETSPANAIVTLRGEQWAANGSVGGGSVRLVSLEPDRGGATDSRSALAGSADGRKLRDFFSGQ